MITISIDPIIFSIGHFMVRWYSLILMLAMAVGIWLTAREANRKGFKKDLIYDIAVWIVFAGILGARLFHVLDHWSDEYAANPIRALYIWEGGLAIWGGVAGGLLAAAILAWKNGWKFPKLLDAGAPGLVLAQASVACLLTAPGHRPACARDPQRMGDRLPNEPAARTPAARRTSWELLP